MDTLQRSLMRASIGLALLLCVPCMVSAQLISLKTVPLAAGDQFQLFPSKNLGMGGVSIALDDPLLDPFVNPAKGSRLRDTQLFTAPVFYSVSDGAGGSRALPAGLLFSSGQWFGAAALSLQELELADRGFGPIPVFDSGVPEVLSAKSASNVYASAVLGGRVPGSNLSIGGSVFWAGLDALQGVDLLYPGSQRIDQTGHLLDVRVGLLGELEGDRSYEVLMLYSGLDMTHDVTYVDWIWPTDDGPIDPEPDVRTETNLDRTNTWGLHLGYVQPLAADGWRVGGILTTNYKSHPKIPNYELMNIPRDPGDTWAFDVGIGVSRSAGLANFGLDLILEPIWSDTWAEAEEPVETRSGKTIPAGGRTIENDFSFTNAIARMGVGVQHERVGFQIGLQVYSYDYQLKQTDLVEERRRKQSENWLEWTPSLGLGLVFPEFEVRYVGRVTTGTGQPGVAWTATGLERAQSFAPLNSDYIIAPSGPLTLQEADVVTHQISVNIPIRG